MIFRQRKSSCFQPVLELLEDRSLMSVFAVINTNDTGPGSLRQAIFSANAHPNSDARDEIHFAIPGSGVHTIEPTTVLPSITDPVIIDGYSQPGSGLNTLAGGNNAILTIELSGASLTETAKDGLTILAGESTVRGLVINRFSSSGIALSRGGGNTIVGNFLGTDPSGEIGKENVNAGIELYGTSRNTIGGTSREAQNVLSGNGSYGLWISQPPSQVADLPTSANLVQGNRIGTNPDGTAAVPNRYGIQASRSSHNTIGGSVLGAGNIVSGNRYAGVFLWGVDGPASGNLIQGNSIGTDGSRTSALPNGAQGIVLNQASGNTIGGAEGAGSNFVSGNGHFGIAISRSSARNIIVGNRIGITSAAAPLGNGAGGILIDRAAGNTIGGLTQDFPNRIGFNHGPGVSLPNYGTGNSILRNLVFGNAGLGIDLGADGVTPNDVADNDAGPNRLQNYPMLTSAGTGESAIFGTLNSTPNTQFRLLFFDAPRCDPSGYGEGQRFIGSQLVTTDVDGNAAFRTSFPVSQFGVITATATDASGNTSEFSACTVAGTFLVTGADSGGGPAVRIFDIFRRELARFHAYDSSFSGGVRVAEANLDEQGSKQIVTAPGPGTAPIVKIFSGTNLLRSFSAYDTFTGGVFVTAGDVDGDGTDEIITGADAGGGPAVRVFTGTGTELLRFHAYATTFSGGVRVAAGDTNGDGRDEIIVSPGRGGTPQIRIFDGTTAQLIRAFLAYDSTFTGGVYVTAGDVRDDLRDEIITGAGPGGGPAVRVFNGSGIEKARFHAYDRSFTGGVRVAVVDADGDGKGDIITGPGPGTSPRVRLFDGASIALLDEFFAYDETFTGGVFVAGG